MITTYNKLRAVKDSLPSGSMTAIAEELNITAEEVRAYFGAKTDNGMGLHIEPGPDGGLVILDNTRILEVALRMLWEYGR